MLLFAIRKINDMTVVTVWRFVAGTVAAKVYDAER